MKLIKIMAAALLLTTIPAMAQQKKQFTLDDLVPGGSGFWNLYPQYMYATWWGDLLVKTEVEKASVISNQKGETIEPQTLFTAAAPMPIPKMNISFSFEGPLARYVAHARVSIRSPVPSI